MLEIIVQKAQPARIRLQMEVCPKQAQTRLLRWTGIRLRKFQSFAVAQLVSYLRRSPQHVTLLQSMQQVLQALRAGLCVKVPNGKPFLSYLEAPLESVDKRRQAHGHSNALSQDTHKTLTSSGRIALAIPNWALIVWQNLVSKRALQSLYDWVPPTP